MSTFSGLSIALSSLYAQRKGLEVTGHNVANVNTDGYSRQRVGLEGVGGNTVPAIHSKWTGAGAGVGVTGVDRLRDQFLESRALLEHSTDSRLRHTQGVMARAELAFAEPSTNGLQAQMAELWAGWGDVANHPTDLAARSQLLEQAKTLATGFNRTREEIGTLWESQVEQLQVTVSEVNATAARVAELNGAIERATKGGLSPNDLADQRDRLVLELSQSIGATVRPGEAGVVDVFVGGTALVRGATSERLQVSGSATISDVAGEPVQVQWAKDGYPAAVSGGRAGGMLEAANVTLPTMRDGVDAVARELVDVVNGQHGAGYDLDGAPGQPLLSWNADTGMAVAITDPRQLAAASDGPDGAGSPSLDGRNALDLSALTTAEQGPDAAYRSFIVALGVETQAANRRVQIQADITNQLDAVRDAESGVNLDEEMANMVAYQHAYNASARHLTAVDQMLETLIRGTGLVGR